MKKIVRLIPILLILIVSCKTTLMQDEWKDENYSKEIRKVFIIGVAQRADIRQIFENEFGRQLATRGIDAISSYKTLSPEKMLDKDTIVSKISDLNIDAVIITKVIQRRREYYQQRSIRQSSYHGYYSRSYSNLAGSRASSADIVSLETNLYDAESEKLVWSALSETFIFSTPEKAIKPFIETMVKKLSEDNIL